MSLFNNLFPLRYTAYIYAYRPAILPNRATMGHEVRSSIMAEESSSHRDLALISNTEFQATTWKRTITSIFLFITRFERFHPSPFFSSIR